MVASHDLCQDLGISTEELDQRRAQNAELDRLVIKYDNIDQRTINAEVQSPGVVGDDEVRSLKEQRLEIKDKIMQQLEDPGAGD